MKKFINKAHVEGYVFNSELVAKVSKKGVPFIGGFLKIATDDSATNVVDVHFSYVPEKNKNGNDNQSYGTLMDIINNAVTFEEAGTEATRVRVDGEIDVNEWYAKDTDELVSQVRFEGKFVHKMMGGQPFADSPANFKTDMLITNCTEKENSEGDMELDIKGYVFDFFGNIKPVTYRVRSKGGVDYFLGQDITPKTPLLTNVWGDIVSAQLVREKITESAFGEPTVEKIAKSIRLWDIVGASNEPMEFDSEETITKSELKKALADREVMLAENKQRAEEYRKTNGGKKNSAFKTETKPVKKATTVVEEDDDEEFDFMFD